MNRNSGETEFKKQEIRLPADVRRIIGTLEENGYEAFAVGGCVRDSLLGRVPGDWDITTSALPQEVKRLFRKTVDTGIAHGTVSVLLRKRDTAEGVKKEETGRRTAGVNPFYAAYEVTTYRVDGVYKDGRHPESVSFTPSLLEDLKRRDFTINAMAYSPQRGLMDEFDGISDLQNGVIRCVGDPDARFSEDALRILRAVRFGAQLSFAVEPETERAIRTHVANLAMVSRERIQTELSKLLCSAHPERVSELFRLGMEPYICEKFDLAEHGIFSALRTEFQALPLSRKYRRYAMLLTGLMETDARAVLRGLKLDNDTVKKALILSGGLLRYIPAERYALKKVMQTMTPELMRELLELKKMFRDTVLYRAHCYGEDADALSRLFEDILRKEEPVYLSDLAVRGSDLLAAGVPSGPYIGEILASMLDDVQHEPVHNSVLYLLSQHLGVRTTRGKV